MHKFQTLSIYVADQVGVKVNDKVNVFQESSE